MSYRNDKNGYNQNSNLDFSNHLIICVSEYLLELPQSDKRVKLFLNISKILYTFEVYKNSFNNGINFAPIS